jgi:adenylate cyclase
MTQASSDSGSRSVLALLKRWRALCFVLIIVALSALVLMPQFQRLKFIYAIEQSALSLRFMLRGVESTVDDPAQIVIVGIDDHSLYAELSAADLEQSPEARYMGAQWPWNREVYGVLAQRLIDAGARVVAFDLIFPTPNEGDWGFYDCIAANQNKIVLGYDYVPSESEKAETPVQERLPYDDLLPEDTTGLLGFVNIKLDEDGVLRRAKLSTNQFAELWSITDDPVQGERLGRLAHAATKQYGLGVQAALLFDSSLEPSVPGVFESPLINYGGLDYFTAVSVADVLLQDRFESQAGVFDDAIVFVGPSSDFFKDLVSTPWGDMYGVESHAHVARSLLNGSFIHPLSRAWYVGLMIALSVLLCAANLCFKGVFHKIVSLFILLLSYLLISQLLFVDKALLLPLLGPVFMLVMGGFALLVFDFAIEQYEKRRLRGYLSRYLSPEIAQLLSDDSSELEALLRGASRPIAVLFSDIRGFTTLSEQYAPEGLVAHLNEYFESMVDGIHQHHGSLNKYIGDAILAFWGGFYSKGDEEDCTSAIQSALDMNRRMERLNAGWSGDADKAALQIGIGISYGPCFVGNLGHSQRMEFAVMGDVVNLGARLEGATKQYGCAVLVSEAVYASCRDRFYFQELDVIQVKGKTQGIAVYAPLSACDDGPPPEWLALWNEALRAYRSREFERAQREFRDLGKLEPAQQVATQLYIERCEELLRDPPPDDWDFVYVMRTK